MRQIHETAAALGPMASAARFAGLGARILGGTARFTGPRDIVAGETCIRARRFVVATGSRPTVPAIPGLDAVPYLTEETLFANPRLPDHLVIIGAGRVGIEMAQAHARLGSGVTLLDSGTALAEDDPELAELLCQRLRAEGITLRESVAIAGVERDGAGIALVLDGGERLTASHLLIAAGRTADVDGLDLARAGVAHGAGGIRVDAGLRTTNRRIYAIGDIVAGPPFIPQSAHVAAYHAGIVVRSALFRLPARVDYRALPQVVFSDPELAQVGMTEAAARARYGDALAILRASFHENGRAQAERLPHGLVKIVTRRNGRILGAAILGAAAGELIQPWVLAIGEGMKITSLAGMIAPAPTLGEASKQAATSYFVPKLLNDRTRRLVAFLARFG
jgi:pyruvate/2-oxoglutarate dehydrogenase complex dihydrolipoamide dehydrogenase (E3) component